MFNVLLDFSKFSVLPPLSEEDAAKPGGTLYSLIDIVHDHWKNLSVDPKDVEAHESKVSVDNPSLLNGTVTATASILERKWGDVMFEVKAYPNETDSSSRATYTDLLKWTLSLYYESTRKRELTARSWLQTNLPQPLPLQPILAPVWGSR